MGTLVQERFKSIEELKAIKPVKEVTGTIVGGGPFSLREAVRVAGKAVIKKMFPGFKGTKPKTRPRPKNVLGTTQEVQDLVFLFNIQTQH